MGLCVFCGKKAGSGLDSHKECVRLYVAGEDWIVSMIGAFVSNERDTHQLKQAIDLVAKMSYINNQARRPLIVKGWKQAVDQALEDHVLTVREERALYQIIRQFNLSDEEIKKDGAISRIDHARIIRNIMEGVIPEFPTDDLQLPFNFQKSEKVVWLFANVDYYEQRKSTRYRIGSQEFKADLATSLYLKTTDVSAELIESEETVHVDRGILGVTTKHIYFAGSQKSIRINYDNIVTFKHYSDGIGVVQDTPASSPQEFVTSDGWFTYNLVTNLARLA